MADLIGKIINGKYKLTHVLGEGGMGTVYEAEHTLINRKVAIKVMNEEFTTNREVVERFVREAQSSSSIGHPNIIEIEDVGREKDGTVYIVMELLAGKTLKELLKEKKQLPPAQVVSILVQTLSALKAAHEKKIVHRDLKPDNLFLSEGEKGNFELKLLDFGIAKVQNELEGDQGLTKTGTVLGTPNYMSPEQARGRSVDQRIDIWAAGVILYEMLAGKRPYGGESYNEVLSCILLETPRPLKEITEGAPIELISSVEMAMKKDPEDRYQNVTEMAADLEEYVQTVLGDQPLSSVELRAVLDLFPSFSGKKGIIPKKKKDKNSLGIILLLLIFILGFGAVSLILTKKEDQTYSEALQEITSYWTSRASGILSGGTEPEAELVDTDISEKVAVQELEEKKHQAEILAEEIRRAEKELAEKQAAEEQSATDIAAENASSEVTIELKGVPKKAHLTIDGKKVRQPITLPTSAEPVTLKVVTRKNKPFIVEIVPDKDQEVVVKLKRRGRFRLKK